MNITIRRHKELKSVVSAKELYTFLKTKKSFTELFVKNIERGTNKIDWHEDKDYIILYGDIKNADNTPRIDYLITPRVAFNILTRNAGSINNVIKARKFFRLLVDQQTTIEKIQKYIQKLMNIENRIIATNKLINNND